MHAQVSGDLQDEPFDARPDAVIVDLADRAGVDLAVRHLTTAGGSVRWRFVSSWLDDPARRADHTALLAHRWAVAALCVQRTDGPGAVTALLQRYLDDVGAPPPASAAAVREAERDLEATLEDLAWLAGGVPALPALVVGNRLRSLAAKA